MVKFIKPFIEKIVNVKGDEKCEFRTIVEHKGLIEEIHCIIRRTFIKDVKDHMSDYMCVFEIEKRFNYIMNDLYPLQNSIEIVFQNKWLSLQKMLLQ